MREKPFDMVVTFSRPVLIRANGAEVAARAARVLWPASEFNVEVPCDDAFVALEVTGYCAATGETYFRKLEAPVRVEVRPENVCARQEVAAK